MFCTNCKAAADLKATAAADDDRIVVKDFRPADPAEITAEIDRLHTLCLNGQPGCPCQHRGTTAVRRPVTA